MNNDKSLREMVEDANRRPVPYEGLTALGETTVSDQPKPTEADNFDPHPHGRARFNAVLEAMTSGKKPSEGTSRKAPSAGYSGTRTRRGKGEGTSD